MAACRSRDDYHGLCGNERSTGLQSTTARAIWLLWLRSYAFAVSAIDTGRLAPVAPHAVTHGEQSRRSVTQQMYEDGSHCMAAGLLVAGLCATIKFPAYLGTVTCPVTFVLVDSYARLSGCTKLQHVRASVALRTEQCGANFYPFTILWA